jgi:hypothetical protein
MMVHINKMEIPKGYIAGLGRDEPKPRVAHLYNGTFSDPGPAMCKKGYNRPDGYSIWRGNFGKQGVCAKCLSRVARSCQPIPWPDDEDA